MGKQAVRIKIKILKRDGAMIYIDLITLILLEQDRSLRHC